MTSNNIKNADMGLYVHIPFCKSKCRYCSFFSQPIENHNPDRLIAALLAEMKRYPFLSSVRTAYIGGGSPSCLPSNSLIRLIEHISDNCKNLTEFTVEFNPGQADLNILKTIKNLGVSRLSIGAQSFIPAELEILGRAHTVDCIYNSLQIAERAGFDNISIDLIFAIPGSTIKSWKSNLAKAVNLPISHISAYSLTYEESTPLTNDIHAGRLKTIDEQTDREMYELAIETLEDAGFVQYEISNFAKPAYQCRHNLGYWLNRPFIGIGPSAASYLQNRRIKNISDIKKYIEAIESGKETLDEVVELTPDDIASETAVLSLRLRNGIDIKKYQQQVGISVCDTFAEPIKRYTGSGFIKQTNDRIYLTKKALPVADSILCDFVLV
jgi:oxygen-independent coproporphyrinogen-3 oxidase